MDPDITSDKAFQQGLRFLLGEGVPKDEAKARVLLVQAAEAGNPSALNLAAEMLTHGQGGPFDRATAFRYVERAAGLGDPEAAYTLGYYYMTGGMGNLGYSREILDQMQVKEDEARGLTLWKEAGARGHALATYRMGEYYEERAKDIAQAIHWYEQAIELGEPNGLIRLGDFNVLGKGVPKDLAKARSLYQRAATSDDSCASSTGKQRLEDFDELETILKEDC
jgi:uncharacterized protein